jgi:hypothetical protein
MIVECMLRVVNKVGQDARQDSALTKSGDIIEVLPLGSNWGSEVYARPDWRIIKIDAPATMIEALMAGETGYFVYRLAKPRRYEFNWQGLPQSYRDLINANVTTITDLTALNIGSYTRLKEFI